MSVLSLMRWAEDYPPPVHSRDPLSYVDVSGTHCGAAAVSPVPRLHLTGMSLSYILMLTAFYVDNGKSLPLWKELPPIADWLLPAPRFVVASTGARKSILASWWP